MKRVILICLFSLSGCLSEQSLSKDAKPMEQPPANSAAVDLKPQIDSPEAPKISSPATPSQEVPSIPVQSGSLPAQPMENSVPTENTPQTKINITVPVQTDSKQNATKPEENKTDSKLPDKKDAEAKPIDEKKVEPSKDTSKNETTAAETTGKGGSNGTVIDDKEKKDTSTSKNEIMKPTETPALQARGFDGPSFIGGIILTLGLIAISFMGYKYYKNQTERNYYGTL